MSRYDWEEVKRLAADFQRTQFQSTAQKLTERNCVEIITRLIQLKLLDVVFTNDGKSYITREYLIKEIKDELYVHNGRINLIDVSKSLNVDSNIISTLAHEVVKEDNNIRIILGQLIDHSYVIQLAEEIGDRLQQHGFINVTELARNFDLPGEYIHSVIKENCIRMFPGLKQDKQDTQTYYTETYLNKNKAIVRGALTAISKPTLINTVVSHCGINENILFGIIDNLIESKQVPGIITERCGNVCTYIPHIYLKSQSDWVHNFFNQNKYLEYDALIRVGINDPKLFISKTIQTKENLHYLRNCVVSQSLLDQTEASIEEAVTSNSWINILNVLPSVINSQDAEIILQNLINKYPKCSTFRIFNLSYAVSESFLVTVHSRILQTVVPDKVEESVRTGKYEQHLVDSKVNNFADSEEKKELTRKEERKKRATIGKSGGGTQGRETKTKTTKKKYGQKGLQRAVSDEDNSKKQKNTYIFELVSTDDIQNVIMDDKSFQDEEFDDADFVETLIQYFYESVNKEALSMAQSLYETKLANINISKRKMNAELQDAIISSYQDFKLYCKGIKEFSDADCQLLLEKYLLKSTGTQLTNACFTFINEKDGEINSAEARQKLLQSMDCKDLKESFMRLNKFLNGNSVDEFISVVDDVLFHLNIMTKKIDKRKEKILLELHKQALIEKLKETEDPPLVLHLASLILFQTVSQSMLNASGRFVSSILQLLEKQLPNEEIAILKQYQSLVVKLFKMNDEEEDHVRINEELKNLTAGVKVIALQLPSRK